ncbi:tRNA (N(6)-L-threonylcarbamoyladenosine(37)-C(2))-methylthiotransferase MtaB [Xiashengella succiniciproducens]|uniref:tRNA (N(6)-L-threonylcarbamoyladenosine(37)-C(2))-methylthiotransferase MtaB n=1 Tax=Xiashengella succiniciproducens TaxID=2949635 RepID=A0A9J6ZMV5_9BACT|nr:tRNA (N(6)-L-threonylcarbamoyladenosine(37)-C(2))-methylthiotransferase MtaB [Alkaliflexus sp. Ai-910]URW78600.1 tRNA (N(6)-L-threonylcarbamoyladenosine(37)-C(2))-methylthiotransferase MtaB [Alkaliflexus sp. Ai-910]
MKVAFRTLGCRLNQYEMDALAAQFKDNGYEVSEQEHNADIVVVNTCTVTNQSNQKSRQAISHATRVNPGARMIITGCMTESHAGQLQQKFPNATIINNKAKSAIFHSVDSLLKGGSPVLSDKDFDLFSYQSFTEMFHTRSLVKIQDGCDNFCTFCIIPFVRGRAISRPSEKVLENVRDVVAKGAKEIVLTGVNISRYNHEGLGFSGLLEQILDVEGDFRVRISSIEPDRFNDHFFSLVGHPKLAPHLHLCLQSGSDRILLQMRRMYSVKDFMKIVENVRKKDPLFNFTTDVIVGFPGETEQEFADTMKLSKEVGFGHMHIFKYSVRQNTRAARMPEQVNEKIKTERSRRMHELAAKLQKDYRAAFDNTEQRILVEKWENGMASGYNGYYVPMQFASENKKRNRFETVLARVKDF